MTIQQQPESLNLSGNVPDFILTGVTDMVSFKLYQDATLLLDEQYYPDTDGRIRIKMADLISQQLFIQVPDYAQTVFHQPQAHGAFTAEIDEDPLNFTVVKGFLQRPPFDVPHFLQHNWLTTAPYIKAVKFHDPEWLTCYPVSSVVVRIRATFPDATTQTVTYATLEANKVQSINVNPGLIIGLFTQEPAKWEIYTEASGQQRQSTRTYLYGTGCDQHDDLFVFENRLGGIDTIRFTGTATRNDSSLFENARFDEYVVDFFAAPELSVQKNTGPLGTRLQLNHALDFFRSLRKHHLTHGFIAGIYLDKPVLESTKGELNSFTFDFSYSDFKIAYPEIAIPPQLLDLPD